IVVSGSGTVTQTSTPAGPAPAGAVAQPPRPEVELLHAPSRARKPHPGGNGGQAAKPRYAFRFVDPTGAATFYCSLDGSPFRRCSSPKVYGRLPHGKHVFRVKAT